MALGGGQFSAMTKALPGTYINFISRNSIARDNHARGVVAVPIELDFGADEKAFKVEIDELRGSARRLFGHSLDSEKLVKIREIFKHATTAYFFKLNTGGQKAKNEVAEALYTGVAGNSISITIGKDVDDPSVFVVTTTMSGVMVDSQRVKEIKELQDNGYVHFLNKALAAGTTKLTGGTNGTINGDSHAAALKALEACNFNVLVCASAESTIKDVYVEYTKRMREERGVKFQTVVYDKAADHEGVINLKTPAEGDDTGLVYWIAGAEAGCAFNKSVTNMIYDGEFEPKLTLSQSQLERSIEKGEFVMHKVGDDVRVLVDNNSLTTYTDSKGKVFAKNDTIRTIDELAMSEAKAFNENFIGVKNTAANRGALWAAIVQIHNDMQALGAIEDFKSDDIVIKNGDSKTDVVVTAEITVTNAMERLYISTYIA